MKISLKVTLLITLLGLSLASCSNKTASTKKSTNSSSTSNSTTTGTGTTTGDDTTDEDCADGVYHSGATRCYYTNLPRVSFNGPGDAGPVYWSSKVNLTDSSISQNQFRSDSYFSVRMKPSRVIGGTSIQGRKCSSFNTNASKVQIDVMVRRAESSLGTIKTISANFDSYSNVARFTKNNDLPGTTEPYIIEIVKVYSNSRCVQAGGSDTAYCPYHNMPVTIYANDPAKTAATVTECVGVQLEVATDDTYDFPK